MDFVDRAQEVLDFLRSRKRSYGLTFQKNDHANTVVLRDLAKYCHANDMPNRFDAITLARLAGRREVWLRIQQHLHLSEDELVRIFDAAGVSE